MQLVQSSRLLVEKDNKDFYKRKVDASIDNPNNSETHLFPLINKNKSKVDYHQLAKAIVHGQNNYRKRFLIAKKNYFTVLKTTDIAYIIVEAPVVYAVDFYGEKYPLDYTLDRIEKQLNPTVFFRANRQTIINVEAIKKVEPYFNKGLIAILVDGLDRKVAVSRAKSGNFRKWLNF
ncbi:MAG: LytTR family transcriptional regulator DNA-binding domain-containing protein [Carboxylicivirga sp.]|jgi:DNA-binding LytR/AlgR family response regulator|nr:LytTR family transcriptional regulator DNA-binding domain-containing protein [Carboxylicivirga sp.]